MATNRGNTRTSPLKQRWLYAQVCAFLFDDERVVRDEFRTIFDRSGFSLQRETIIKARLHFSARSVYSKETSTHFFARSAYSKETSIHFFVS